MGIVGEHLVGLIAKQVEERSLVVWYDPGADYGAVAESLTIPGTTIARYDGSFLKLRRAWSCSQGSNPTSGTTRLAPVACNALKSIIGDDNAAEVEKQVDQGKLTLKDVDGLGSDLEGVAKGVISVVFHTGNSQEIALTFLASDRLDAEIEKKSMPATRRPSSPVGRRAGEGPEAEGGWLAASAGRSSGGRRGRSTG